MMNRLIEIIRKQQSGHKNDPIFAIGEQLLEMVRGDEKATEILINDLTTKGMSLSYAAAHFKKCADDNRDKEKCFCITPSVAEKLLREFYCLPEKETPDASVKTVAPFVDLSDFM